MAVLDWVVVVIVIIIVAAVVGWLVLRLLNRGTPRVSDALERLPSRTEQPVAFSEGRTVTEAEEPPTEASEDAAFERVLREELDEVRGEDQQV
jgi:hypothetical protein